jgi:acetaldehyde dehydrogenase
MKVSIIGTGKIGTDIYNKLKRIDNVKIVAFVGRRNVKRIEKEYISEGLDYFRRNIKCCDVVFDCTDAQSAIINNSVFADQSIQVIDLTPSKIGFMCVPGVNCDDVISRQNISMITCGGQVSIPVIYFVSRYINVKYVEVITQISSASAGIATRLNVDNYIHTTEYAIKKLTGVPDVKVILNINPGDVFMNTTIFFKITIEPGQDFSFFEKFNAIYSPDGIMSISVKIENSRDKLPGNLDVINTSAIKILKELMLKKYNESQ